jgi:hypothetical protein
MATDEPVSVATLLPMVEAALTAAKKAAMARAQTVLSGALLDVTVTGIRRTERTLTNLEQEREALTAAVRAAMANILGGTDNNKLGTLGDLQATAMQADACCIVQRAESLRHTSCVRRKVHAAARRRSHGVDGGYIDRRVISPIVDRLKESKNAPAPSGVADALS